MTTLAFIVAVGKAGLLFMAVGAVGALLALMFRK